MDQPVPDIPRKGRGAVSNRSGRYEAEERFAIDDGWGAAEAEPEPEPERLDTTVTADASRTVIARNSSPDIPFDRSINPYRGCEHGCVYCFARPTHAWLGLSPGLDFESRLFAKHDAPTLLAAELRRPKYQCRVIALGTNTDPYQPIERELGITRGVLQVLSDFKHPVGIVTKSALVRRDTDILVPMSAEGLAAVFVSVTTLDPSLARRLEPRAPTPSRRLETIAALSKAGVRVGVMAAPMIPGLNDSELEAILESAAGAGAASASYVLLRLPLEIKSLFTEWLEAHVPDRAARVMSLVRETRGGKLYDSTFGMRMKGQGPYAELIGKRFELAVRRHGLAGNRFALATHLFSPPPRPGDQLSLL